MSFNPPPPPGVTTLKECIYGPQPDTLIYFFPCSRTSLYGRGAGAVGAPIKEFLRIWPRGIHLSLHVTACLTFCRKRNVKKKEHTFFSTGIDRACVAPFCHHHYQQHEKCCQPRKKLKLPVAHLRKRKTKRIVWGGSTTPLPTPTTAFPLLRHWSSAVK